jgi:hypothetical protein
VADSVSNFAGGVEAFFHATYFLQMAVKYGPELEYPPRVIPSGWAALLYLHNLR